MGSDNEYWVGGCEDAPCCGCCGPVVWAAEMRAAEDYRSAWLSGLYDEEDM